ncbi:MAG: ABC transporter permease [Acidimicrobiia bacterium]|nr:ABC transporter permease [Acidimicrobiia bacterium]MCY4458520.1 ABC transporter permease [Acidimicrobiaceae bacterium]
MAEGPGGHAISDNIDQQNRLTNWPFNWLFRKKGADARKTVTFGDASEVSGALLWTVASVVFVLALWFVATNVWGLPQEWQSYGDEVRAGLEEDESYVQRDLLRDCDNHATNPQDYPADLPSCSYQQWLSESTLPTPLAVWDEAIDFAANGYSGFTMWQHLWLSFSRLAKGLFWGVALGVPIGLAMGLSNRWRGIFDPIVELLRPIPPLALIPLFIIWFGIGEEGKVNLLLFAAIWIMVIAARSGVLAVNTTKVHAAYSLGASKAQVLRHVILPNALPEIFTGLRVAIGVCWGTLVAAELLGASAGLGFTIFKARQFLLLDLMLSAVIVISILGVTMDVAMRMAERRLIPWRGKG